MSPVFPALLGCALLPVVSPPRPLPRCSGKPGPVQVFVAADESIAPLRSVVQAKVHVRPSSDVRTLTVSLSAIGRVDVLDGPVVLDDVRGGAERVVPVRFLVRAEGEGEVRATITGQRADGAALGSTSAVLYLLAARHEVLFARTGFLDLRVARLDRQLQTRVLDGARHAAAVESLRGGGLVVRPASAPPAVSRLGNVSGHVLWTDRSGGTHPVRFAPVQILDARPALARLAVTSTDLSGRFEVRVPWGVPFIVRVLAQGPGFAVRSEDGVVQHVDTFPQTLTYGAGLEVDLTANNVDDNNTAFSVADGVVTANEYIERTHGSRFPDLDVVFPSDGTYFDGSIHLLRLDRFDWDVLMHEFGHYVSQNLRIDDNPGGPHEPGNLGESRGKDVGIRLAWAEGWPTFFSISAQLAMNAGALGIPYVGDTRYSDTEDADFEWDLEAQTGGPGPPPGRELASLGEDDELTVQRILWDLFDVVDDAGDAVSFGDRDVWDRLDASDAATLSGAYAGLVAGRSSAAVAAIGCVFTEHRVAPAPQTPADGSTLSSSPPTFTWAANGGGPSNRNDRFIVEVYDAGFTTLLFASPEQSAISFTPSPAAWSALLPAAGGSVHWLVRGAQSNNPPTGPYRSCPRVLR